MLETFVKWVNAKDLFTSQDSHIAEKAEKPKDIDPWSVIGEVVFVVIFIVSPIVLGVYSLLR